jgi:hypothetical protein
MKKITGDAAFKHYNQVDEDGVLTSRKPEFTRMSLKPGIGAGWLDKYHADVYPHDFVVVNGRKNAVPRYYDKKISKNVDGMFDDYDIDEIQYVRCLRMREAAPANSDRSLAARNEHNVAKLKLLKRTIE